MVAFLVVMVVLTMICVVWFWWIVIREHRADKRDRVRPGTPLMDSRDVDELLAALRKHGFTMHLFGNRDSPDIVAAHRRRSPDYTDVLILRSERKAAAYRAVTTDVNTDLFCPERLVWHYLQAPAPVLRALYALPAPGHAQAAHTCYPPPPECRIPPEERRHSRMFPPPCTASGAQA